MADRDSNDLYSRIEVIDDQSVAILKAMTPEQRANQCFAMFSFARGIVESSIRDRWPSLPDDEVIRRVAERMNGISS